MNESLRLVSPPQPDSHLARWLGYGALAALAAGFLGAVSAALSLAGWETGTLSPLEIVNLAALVCLVVVLLAYWHMSRHLHRLTLRQSALGIVGILLLLELASLNLTEGPLRWWNIAIWIGLLVLTALLLLVVWNLHDLEQDANPEQPSAQADESQPSSSDSSSQESSMGVRIFGWLLTALGFVGVIALKVSIKMGIRKLVRSMDLNLFELLVLVSLLILLVAFVIWFALVKIRLRQVLGSMAVLVGALELFLLLAGAIALIAITWQMIPLFRQPDLTEEAMDAAVEGILNLWIHRLDLAALVLCLLWGMGTAKLFLSYRKQVLPVQVQPG